MHPLYALDQRLKVETFLVLTGNETWAGAIHAKLAAVGMTATNFSIAN